MNFEDVELEDLSTNSNDKTKLLKKKENEDNSLTVSCYIGYFFHLNLQKICHLNIKHISIQLEVIFFHLD